MSMADRDGFIWYDGKLVPWREANTHVLTHSLHYGLAVFEGVRAYKTESLGTAIFRLQEHTRRLFNSAICTSVGTYPTCAIRMCPSLMRSRLCSETDAVPVSTRKCGSD